MAPNEVKPQQIILGTERRSINITEALFLMKEYKSIENFQNLASGLYSDREALRKNIAILEAHVRNHLRKGSDENTKQNMIKELILTRDLKDKLLKEAQALSDIEKKFEHHFPAGESHLPEDVQMFVNSALLVIYSSKKPMEQVQEIAYEV